MPAARAGHTLLKGRTAVLAVLGPHEGMPLGEEGLRQGEEQRQSDEKEPWS